MQYDQHYISTTKKLNLMSKKVFLKIGQEGRKIFMKHNIFLPRSEFKLQVISSYNFSFKGSNTYLVRVLRHSHGVSSHMNSHIGTEMSSRRGSPTSSQTSFIWLLTNLIFFLFIFDVSILAIWFFAIVFGAHIDFSLDRNKLMALQCRAQIPI